MSKGLEAFERFCDDVMQCINSGGIHYVDKKNKDIIEKELRALKIIKENQLNVGNIIHDIKEHGLTYQEYLDCYDYYQYGGTQLTQEEYRLLEETLCI